MLSFSGSAPTNVQCLACGVRPRLGANLVGVILLSPSLCRICWPPVNISAPSASLRGIFRGRLQPNHRSSVGCHQYSFTSPIRTDIPLNTSRCLTNHQNLGLSIRFLPGRHDERCFNRADDAVPHWNGALRRRLSDLGSQSSAPHCEPPITVTWRSTRAAVCAYVA